MKFNTKTGAYISALLFGLMLISGLGQGALAQAQVIATPNACVSLQSNVGIGAYDVTTGNAVSALQNFLANQGYFSSIYLGTGHYGAITFSSVAKFQAAHGIPATGFVGPLTRAAITSVTCGTGVSPVPANGLALYSIAPTSGAVGTMVTITGAGFTSSNTVLMDGNVAASNVPVTSNFAIPVACVPNTVCTGGARQTLTFTIPGALAPYCAAGQMCAQYMRDVTPGTYAVTVLNSNGTSNTINLTVTGGGASGALTLYVANPSSAAMGSSVTLGATGLTNDNTILIDGMIAAQHVPLINTFACIPSVTCNTNYQALMFTVPTSLSPDCTGSQVCALYLRLLSPGTYSLAIENANGKSNAIPFTVTGATANNNQLSISGLSAPASLSLGQSGTWTVNAVSNGSGNLHYSVVWGDEATYYNNGVAASPVNNVQSSATFAHAYQRAGNFTPIFTVTDDFGHSVSTSNTVVVTPLY